MSAEWREPQIRGRISGPGGGKRSGRYRTAQRIEGDISLTLADPGGRCPGASPGRGLCLSSGWESRDQRWVTVDEFVTRPFLP